MRRALLLLALVACGDDSAAPDGAAEVGNDGTAQEVGNDAPLDGAFQEHDEIRVDAGDGIAELIIAPNTLPEGVRAADISVTPVEPRFTTDSEATVLSYELLPSGLRFREPAALILRREWSTTPIGVLESDDGTVELIESETVDPDAALNEVSLPIPHFSFITAAGDFIFMRVRPVSVEASPLPATFMGGLTETRANAEVDTGEETVVFGNGQTAIFVTLVPMEIRGEFATSSLQNLEIVGPTRSGVVDLPSDWDPVFRCTGGGRTAVTINVRYRLSLSVLIQRSGAADIQGTLPVRNTALRETVGTCFGPAISDAPDDCVDSEGPEATCGFFDELIDIRNFGVRDREVSQEQIASLFGNTAYPCDTFGDGLRTVCTGTPGVFPEGAMWIGTMILGADVPDNDPDQSYIYSLVFDSDGDDANNWMPVDPFIWDYFQGTDRWYQLIWNHQASTWTVRATQVDAAQTQQDVPSAVRVVVVQNVVTFFIPVTELASATPTYRFSAFAHDGRFTRATRGGDVSGVDPTEAPRPAPPLAE
ncbi:MAG: hypothetical protein AAF411_02065 [Myxococcota bacterium]